MKPYSSLIIALIITTTFVNSMTSQNKSIEIKGSVMDEYNLGIPYAAVSLTTKYVGTATTEEGDFQLLLSPEHLSDSLSISSIGYKSFKILVKDYIKQKDKVIILVEDIAELSEVSILKPSAYVKNAIRNIKNSTISKPHQLNILYRRTSTEDNKTRFFVEHYLKVADRGPSSQGFYKIQVIEGRKSADYRFIKQKQGNHAITLMTNNNELRKGIAIKKYKWSKIGDTTYDGEDIIIVEGKKGKWDSLKLYIGMYTYGIYKIENSSLNSVYIYKKNVEGKLYLSYHNREWKSKKNLTPEQKILLGRTAPKINLSYRHEMFVLGIEADKKNINVKNYGGYGKDIGDLETTYDSNFWNNFSSPPPTSFHRKNIKEIESIFGVPIQTQFKAVNK